MMSGSVISAITRMVPPQKGHRLISKLKTRLSLCTQLKGALNSSSTLATVSALYSPPIMGTSRQPHQIELVQLSRMSKNALSS